MKGNYLRDNFALRLKKLREERRLTLEQLADRINKNYHSSFTKSMISKWEHGYKAELDSLKILSLYFGVSLNNLLGFNENDDGIKKVEIDYDKIPIVRNISSRKSILAEENILGYAAAPPLFNLNKDEMKDFLYLKIDGKNTGNETHSDSLILINKNQKGKYDNNTVFLVDTGDGIKLVKTIGTTVAKFIKY